MWQGRPAWAEIDLDAIAHNVRSIRGLLGNQVQLMAVVKANAYGHGAVQVARAALEAGASKLAVACVDEAIQLRRAGVREAILILGYVPPWQTEQVLENELQITLSTWELASSLSARATALGLQATVHVKVDTGFGRFGLLPEEVLDFVRRLRSLPSLHLEGLWTHFATADERDKSYTRRQLATYLDTLKALNEAGVSIPCRHVANSAATMEMPETHLDMVRCGIALYGLYPSAEVERTVDLKPAMSLKARVGRIRVLPAGSSISYGRTYITHQPTRVALVPFGYADGFHRSLSNRGSVLVGGRSVSVVGRVCMDQFVVNVQDVSKVKPDDEVVLIGHQGGEQLTAEEVALAAGTINYEVVCSVSARVPRLYYKGGRLVEVATLADQQTIR